LIFFINVPIGIVAFLMTMAFLRDPAYIRKPERGIDFIGLSAMTMGVVGLQYVLERGQHDDWFDSPSIVTLSVVGAACLIFFVIRELRDPHPFVDLRVFKSRSFAAGNVIGVVSGFGLFGLNLILPLFFQNVLGFDAWQTGVALLPGAIATAISMPIAGRVTALVDARVSIAFGLGLFALGSWWMGGLDQTAGFWDIFWPRATQGFALGFLFVPLTTATLSGIPNSAMANATGLYTLLRQLGGSLGIALLEVIIERRQDSVQQSLAAGVTMSNPAVQTFMQNAHDKTQALAQLAQSVEINAATLAYDYAFRFCAIMFAISVFSVFLLRKGKAAGGPAAAAALD
jgi:DHA2 family multidrug resistance protein